MPAIKATTELPRIVRFFEIVEGGACPHCGCAGRWIHRFACDDGTERGAMSGCIKLFRVAPIAREHMRIADKEKRYKQSGFSGLNRWDTESMVAIEAYYAGQTTESDAMRIVERNKSAAAAWRKRKFR